MDCRESLQPRLGAGGEGVPVDVLNREERVERLRGGIVRPDGPHQLHHAPTATKVLERLGRTFAAADPVEDDDVDLVRMSARGNL